MRKYIAFLLLLAAVPAFTQFENISEKNQGKHELRRNFHINFAKEDKASYNLYKRQLMEFATSPVQVPLKWYFSGIAPRVYTVELATDKSFANAQKYTTNVNMLWVDNLLLSQTYYWRVSGKVGGKTVVSPVYTFQTSDTAPRWIRVPGAGNFRDIGNWQIPGGRIKQGMIYRGTRIDREPWLATPEGIDILVKDLKLKTELDLRGKGKIESPLKKYGVNVVAMGYQGYMIGLKKPQIRKMTIELLKLFTKADFYPVYVHCDGGADRTGTLIFFIEAILGVSDKELLLDYEYTTFFGYRNRNTKEMKPFLEMINSQPGKNMAEKAVAFLKKEGLTDRDIAAIRQLLTAKE